MAVAVTAIAPFRVCVYINGVLFWPRSVSIVANAGGHLSFSVDVPAVVEWDILPARSHGAVFFTDSVQGIWRLFCEGEYTGPAWAKTSAGQRSKTLEFRDIHGFWDATTFLTITGLINNGLITATVAAASSKPLTGGSSDGVTDLIFDLNQLISKTSVPENRISSFLPALVSSVVNQTPVECFYSSTRQSVDKLYALVDDDIGSIIDYQRVIDFTVNGLATYGITGESKLEDLIHRYEDLGMYIHTPVPAPPLLNLSYQGRADKPVTQKIAEMLFIPHLYTVIPPACNIIFDGQVSNSAGSRQLLSEPTRVITQTKGLEGLDKVPLLFMANDPTFAIDVSGAMLPATFNAPVALTHEFFSQTELQNGVLAQHFSVGLEKLKPTTGEQKADANGTYLRYMEQITRHYYEVARGEYRKLQLMGAFLPYLVPGFPTIVEDTSGPIYGVIDSVQHTLSCQGAPVTSVVISHVRDLYHVDKRNRGSPCPTWLNRAFLPAQIDATYKDLFGANQRDPAMPHAAMVPQGFIDEQTGDAQPKFNTGLDAAGQADIDYLASYVVPIPFYTESNGALAPSVNPNASLTVATWAKERTNDPQLAYTLYQFRPGTSLYEFAKFHKLSAVTTLTAKEQAHFSDANQEPIPNLDPTLGINGHPLFAHPYGLRLRGRKETASPTAKGLYELVPASNGATMSPLRQRIALAIQEAINRGISRG